MSWSVSAAGNKDKVRQVVSEQFDAAARNYVGQEEAIDVITAKGARARVHRRRHDDPDGLRWRVREQPTARVASRLA
jgi:hypothetical protein